MPEYTADTVAFGTLRLLEARRITKIPARFYQAGSSEMYGDSPPPQDEHTRFNPLSPYAAAKVFAHHVTSQYRDAYGFFACNGILFNHESPPPRRHVRDKEDHERHRGDPRRPAGRRLPRQPGRAARPRFCDTSVTSKNTVKVPNSESSSTYVPEQAIDSPKPLRLPRSCMNVSRVVVVRLDLGLAGVDAAVERSQHVGAPAFAAFVEDRRSRSVELDEHVDGAVVTAVQRQLRRVLRGSPCLPIATKA